jgi:hypothetical protein
MEVEGDNYDREREEQKMEFEEDHCDRKEQEGKMDVDEDEEDDEAWCGNGDYDDDESSEEEACRKPRKKRKDLTNSRSVNELKGDNLMSKMDSGFVHQEKGLFGESEHNTLQLLTIQEHVSCTTMTKSKRRKGLDSTKRRRTCQTMRSGSISTTLVPRTNCEIVTGKLTSRKFPHCHYLSTKGI